MYKLKEIDKGAIVVADVSSVDIRGLKKLYASDPCAKSMLDYVATRKYNSFETTVDRLAIVLSQAGSTWTRPEIIGAFKSLEALGCGVFIIGRRGQPSRFQWEMQMVEVGRAAKGEEQTVQPLIVNEAKKEEPEANELSANSIRHTFNLRPDFTVTFDLPADFSAREATRLADFVRTLPFEPDQPEFSERTS